MNYWCACTVEGWRNQNWNIFWTSSDLVSYRLTFWEKGRWELIAHIYIDTSWVRAASRPYKPVGWKPVDWPPSVWPMKSIKISKKKNPQNVPQKDSALHPGPFNSNSNYFASPHLDFPISLISNPFNSNSNYFASPHLDFPISLISNHLNQIQIILPPHTLIFQFHWFPTI